MYRFLAYTLWWILFILPVLGQNDEGLPFLRNYSAKEYDAGSQNWGVIQDARGIIYCANNSGVLEYDGATWRKIAVSNRSAVGSLVVGHDGRIYVGATGEFGYLAPDAIGQLRYVSLLDKVDPRYHDFADVWETLAFDGRIYFTTYRYLFCFDGDSVRAIAPKTSIHRSFVAHGRIYVRERNVGLMVLIGDSLRLAPDGDIFADESIYVLLPFDSVRTLIGTRTRGFYLYDGMTFQKYPTQLDSFILRNQIYHGVRWDDRFVIGTRRGGVAIMDKKGRMVNWFDKSAGLQDDKVNFVFVDRQDGLWLAMDNGVSRIEASSPLTYFDRHLGLQGIALSSQRHDGVLYVATGQGVYYLALTDPSREDQWRWQFRPVANITSQSWHVLSTGPTLLAATSDGLYEIRNDQGRFLRKGGGGGFFLCRSRRDPTTLFVGLRDGLAVLKWQNNRWIDLGRFKGISEGVRLIVESDDGWLWLGTSFQGVVRVNLSHLDPDKLTKDVLQDASPPIERFGVADGLPQGGVFVFETRNGEVFGTEKGLFRFNVLQKRFYPDSTFGLRFIDTTKSIEFVMDDGQGNVWIQGSTGNHSEIVHLIEKQDGRYESDTIPFLRFSQFKVLNIYAEPNGIKWFCGPDGLIRFDANASKDYAGTFEALLRRVTIGSDSIYFGGATPARPLPSIDYANNSLRFEFSATSFELESSNMFQYQLEGLDKPWSHWSTETTKEYTYLKEGAYQFRVRARNVYGQISREADIDFIVLPPWYRTWWAYVLYVLIGVGLLNTIVRWRAGRLEKEKQALEFIVSQRTADLKRKTEQLEKINLTVKSINSEIEFAPLLQSLLTQMKMIRGVERTAVLVWNEMEKAYETRASDGWDPVTRSPQRFSDEEINREYLPKTRQIADDIYMGGDAHPGFDSSKSRLIMLIRIDGKVHGYLVFENRNTSNAFDDGDVELLTQLKEHITSAFIKARLLDQLKTLNEKKNEFLGIAAHDLRTPLNAIVGFTSLIIDEIKTDGVDLDHTVKDLEDVLRAAQRMAHLVTELLDIAAIESGKVVLNRTTVNMGVIIEECIKFNIKPAVQKRIELTHDIELSLPSVHIDHARILEALDNLVNNAIKFTFPGGRIVIAARTVSGQLVVSVSDTGQGLNEEDLALVFNSFKKLSARPTAGESSTGLGLAIVQKIIGMHGGRVWVESRKGHGSTFNFSIPLLAANPSGVVSTP